MERRRAGFARPASSEEVQLWGNTKQSLSSLAAIYQNQSSTDTVGRVNRLISSWPVDDQLPAEGVDAIVTLHKKLSSGLEEISKSANRESEAIDKVLEQLTVLIALRNAPAEPPLPAVENLKRNKRPRAGTPQVPTTTSTNGTPSQKVSITLPPRGSVGPSSAVPFSREPKARREALAKQLPLKEGRKVAFHPHGLKSSTGGANDTDENTWILAVVTKCINADKNRYEVQDAEPPEEGEVPRYNTTLRAIIPLPDINAPSSSASSLAAYPEFPKGSTVMALYPDTTCFYRAQVVNPPSSLKDQFTGLPTYKLRFEDDDDNEHHVTAQWVVEWPGP